MMTSSDSVNILANLIRQAQIHTGLHSLPEYPEINVISNVKTPDGTPIGNLGDGEAVWHADMTYVEQPLSLGSCTRWRCRWDKATRISLV